MQPTDNTYSSKRFLKIFGIFSILLLLMIGSVNYLVDPFFQFRFKEKNHYFLNPRLVNGGLIRNYNYNTVIIGSSMTQNYDLSILRRNTDVKPVKLATGGMSVDELELVYSLIDKTKVNRFIINIDPPQFNLTYKDMRYPLYLYEKEFLNYLQYLYSYEASVLFTPVDLGLSIYLGNKKETPLEYKYKTNIDDIGNSSLDGHYNAEYVKDLYLSGKSVSYQVIKGMEPRMKNRFDTMISNMELEKNKNISYTFVLPPYSALYWVYTQKSGYYEQFLEFIRHMNATVGKYNNARIAFFFDINEITDLNNYTDITHFSPELSDIILENIDNPVYVLDASNIELRIQRMDSLVNVFKEENKDWLPQ